MTPSYRSMGALFEPQVVYTAPLFQRPYVWKKDDQLPSLWEDIQALAVRIMETGDTSQVLAHFFGTVVLKPLTTKLGQVPRWEIIDGQQRMTTLQILIKAAQHAIVITAKDILNAATQEETRVISTKLAFLSKNQDGKNDKHLPDPEHGYPNDYEVFKIWPTNQDREDFHRIMTKGTREAVKGKTPIIEAYNYFLTEFRRWFKSPDMARRAQALGEAVHNHLKVITLELDSKDEPQRIFETLNAHGTPLLPGDLMKNKVLWEANEQELPTEELYKEFWEQFDSDKTYWREIIGSGSNARARQDMFFQNWLTRVTREPVSVKHVYERFLRFIDTEAGRDSEGRVDVRTLLRDIKGESDRYVYLEKPTKDTRYDVFLHRLSRMNILTFHSVLLALMARNGSTPEELNSIAVMLESYLVRRTVCGQGASRYSALSLTMLNGIDRLVPSESAVPVIRDALTHDRESVLWFPDDEAFKTAWMERNFYSSSWRARTMMILQAIDEDMQKGSSKSEAVVSFNYENLQIEHIMPSSWQKWWTLPAGISPAERDSMVSRIGNLTLVTSKINPEMSNAPWAGGDLLAFGKRGVLEQHSNLKINAKLVADNPSCWNEESIETRGRELFKTARKLWPSLEG